MTTCSCACHRGGAFRPACDVPGGCGHLHETTKPKGKAAAGTSRGVPKSLLEFAKADLAELRRRWPRQTAELTTPLYVAGAKLDDAGELLKGERLLERGEHGGTSQSWDARSAAGDWVQPGRVGWSESSRSTVLRDTHDCGCPWAWTADVKWDPASSTWLPDARPYCPRCDPGRHRQFIANREDPRFGQRHVGSLVEVSGATPVGESPAPGRVPIMDAMWEAQWRIVRLVAWLRSRRGLRPSQLSRKAVLAADVAGVPLWEVLMVRAWDQLAVELDVASTADIDEAAAELRRTLHLIRRAEGDVERTRKIKADCTVCGRKSLRAHIDATDRHQWYVQCHAPRCREEPGLCQACDDDKQHHHRWFWDSWTALGAALGVDVFEAMEGAA